MDIRRLVLIKDVVYAEGGLSSIVPVARVAAWAVIGMLAPYFPALFQRKLAMGLAVPWALLAALALEPILSRTDVGKRQLAGVLVALVLGASSVRWVGRQFWYIRTNVSNTTVHPVFVGRDVRQIGSDQSCRLVPAGELMEFGFERHAVVRHSLVPIVLDSVGQLVGS